jgi:hypothetical protein
MEGIKQQTPERKNPAWPPGFSGTTGTTEGTLPGRIRFYVIRFT